MASPRASAAAGASPLGVALAFLGMFVVGSLAVQLVASAPRGQGAAGPEPVVAHPSTLWSALGER
ncbi:MAG: hypothetical protein VKI81_00040 [Synechococcaceae cyanobacterium]|nr:hypothetical protein [Synechococcaceae cyanobacterium]